MISKINRVKNLGLVFADFRWAAETPPFKKVNLVYGWNGCGKTTLTRLFDALPHPDFEEFEYEIERSDGQTFSQADVFPQATRVFNQHYVEANVRVLESATNKISVLLGEGNKELLEQIQADEIDLFGVAGDETKPGLLNLQKGFTQKRARKEKENDSAFTEIAKAISAATTGAGLATRTYRAPDAKKDFAGLKEAVELGEKQLEQHILSLKQELLPEMSFLREPSAESMPDVLAEIDRAQLKGAEILGMTVEAEILTRLAENPEIAEWVFEGTRIHEIHKSGNCEYCGAALTPERVSALARHFNEADRKLKGDIDQLIPALRTAYASLDRYLVPDALHLYPELRESYKEAAAILEGARADLLERITELGKALKDKRGRTAEVLSVASSDSSQFRAALTSLNGLIERHNATSKSFADARAQTVAAIKTHYLSTIFADVSARHTAIAEIEGDLEKRADQIKALQDRIDANRAKISSDHHACDQINATLKTFLGREELRFVPDEIEAGIGGDTTVTGYRIMRGDAPAHHLSEGERTAIAFVYFVVHLKDGRFDPTTGVIVVDDPISSLDSNSLYQAFSFLKNAVKDGGQVFILTHNFEFLKLLLNWRGKQKNQTGYFMITNRVANGVRTAGIAKMDRELCDYESEYHYLFKRLKQMRDGQDGTIAAAYPVPNIARKVWETFLLFRIPDGSTGMYKKTEALKEQGLDPAKLDAIYKFTNDNSHMTGAGFSPALVQETEKVLGELFEIMEQAAPDHFRILNQATA